DYLNRKLKAQFKSADAFQAKLLLTLGESEVATGQAKLKNNQTREEISISLEDLKKDFKTVSHTILNS
uniref:His/Gly/Thr/Pro-type tRNA ligase C-terminal domain-containing protein n=1 Tax=Streptococcus ferus TaxID=1345 RepID=UPI00359F2D70